MNKRDVAAMIDHTILKPEATRADVARIVEEGAAAGTFSVCVSPSMLPLDVPEGLKVACVVGFPSGAVKPQVKAFEAAQARRRRRGRDRHGHQHRAGEGRAPP